MSETVLVTGATGNVGAEVTRLLVAAGVPLRAAVRPESLARWRGDAPAVPFDFARPETFAPALRGVARLFLMRPPELADTRRFINPLIDAAKAAGVRQIVFLSLLGAARNPVVPHYRVERYLEASGVPWTFLRPSFFMQNLSTTHRADIRDLGEILVPAGNGATSFIDVRDIGAVAAKTLSEPGHEGRAYDLTGGEALTYHDVARQMTDELKRPIAYREPSIPRFTVAMRRRGFNWSFVLVMIGIYTTARLGLAGLVTPDTARLLGRPPISMRRFIADERGCWT